MLHVNAAHRTVTPLPRVLFLTRSTPNAIVSVMVAHAISNSSSRHVNPADNASTGTGMVALASVTGETVTVTPQIKRTPTVASITTYLWIMQAPMQANPGWCMLGKINILSI